MKRIAWTLLLGLLFLTYYLSSIPGLKVVPYFRQVNLLLQRIDLSFTALAGWISQRLPEQFGPAKTAFGDFYRYALKNPDIMEYLLRKCAHVILFFIITLAFFLLLRQYLRSPWTALCGAVFMGSLVAVLDEFHQAFVPGRTGSITDVIIDLMGVALAALFILLALFITRRSSTDPADG